MPLFLFALFFWIASAMILYYRSAFRGWVRLTFAVSAFPLIGLLITSSVVFVNRALPSAYGFLSLVKRSEYFSGAEFYVAFAFYGSIPSGLFWLWLILLRYLDRKRFGSTSDSLPGTRPGPHAESPKS